MTADVGGRPRNSVGYGWAPGSIDAVRTETSPGKVPAVDGGPWSRAVRTSEFVNLVSGRTAPLDTSARLLWDDTALYVAFQAQERELTATFTERDSLLFFENDLEIFIDGGDWYYELEFNARGTVYEVLYAWRDTFGHHSEWRRPEFDVHHPRVHSFAGDHQPDRHSFWVGNHPRGTRWAFLDYDLPGLDVAVLCDGSLNDPGTVDSGWSAVVTLPWAGFARLPGGDRFPPRPGDQLGVLLARFQQLDTNDPSRTTAVGWCVDPHGVPDTHIPESFTRVRFIG